VDDAIVVVEAVHAKMAEKHLSPYRATMEVLHEISGAIIAITLVMTSVFVPVTFIPGPVGTFYRQFGITMATSIVLSGLVALTLTPVLCAMILKPHAHGGEDHGDGDGHRGEQHEPLAERHEVEASSQCPHGWRNTYPTARTVCRSRGSPSASSFRLR
jgi:HAE1 family hydrophobic/amphiphilic exporter-1